MKKPSFFWCQVCFKDLRNSDGNIIIYKPQNLGFTTYSKNVCSEKCFNNK